MKEQDFTSKMQTIKIKIKSLMLKLIIIIANVCGPEEWTGVTLFCLDEKKCAAISFVSYLCIFSD